MSDVALVTVNYNNFECTRGLLSSLIDCGQGYLSEVVVVDNASESEDYEKLCSWVQTLHNPGFRIEVLRNEENVGYFSGLNTGIDRLDSKNEKVIVCNNDIIFQSDFFERLSQLRFSDDVLVLAPDVITLDGVHQNPHSIRRFSRIRKLSYAIYFSNYWVGAGLQYLKRLFQKDLRGKAIDKPCEIYMGIGACYILTNAFLQRCGQLDDRVFLWGEEPLLANQVHEAGGRTCYVPQLVVKHLERRSTGSVPRRSQYCAARKSYRIYRRYL